MRCRVVQIPAFDTTSYQEIEAEVRSVLNESNIVTPDDVRGNYSSLSDAVLPGGRWVLCMLHIL